MSNEVLHNSAESARLAPAKIVWWKITLESLFVLTLLGFILRIVFALMTGTWDVLSVQERAHALLGGLKFDLAAAAALTLLSLLVLRVSVLLGWLKPARLARGWMLPSVITLYLAQMGDALYARESGRHISTEIVEVIGSWDSLLLSVPQYWPFILPLALLVLLIRTRPLHLKGGQRKLLWETEFLIFALVCVVCVRGGIGSLPLSPAHSYSLGRAAVATAGLNGGYAFFYSAVKREVAKPPKMLALSEEEIQQHLKTLYPQADTSAVARPVTPMNVIWVLLESWPAELMQSYGFDKAVTPEFDAIRAKSLTTDALIAGGHRTVEGSFSAFCSFQNAERQSVSESQLMSFSYRCLPQILADNGWDTMFVQGAYRNSAKVGVLMQKLGAKQLFGKEDFPAQLRYPHNSWGVHDPDLYDFVLNKTSQLKEPYFISVNTTTTHDELLPPTVTPQFGMDTFANRKLSVMHFADQALGEFVRKLDKMQSKYPTILVLMADHTAHVNSSSFNHYFIPLAIYAPGLIQPKQIPIAASQRDVAPTVLEMVGVSAPWLAGKSLLNEQAYRFAEYQHGGHIGWIEGDRLTDFLLADGSQQSCYNWRSDPLMRSPLPCSSEEETMKQRAIAFTQYSMKLLFSGKTAQFNQGF